jgi:CheY-like chemotaxis protein
MDKLKSILGHTRIVLADDDADDRDLFNEAMEIINPIIKVEMVRDGQELMDFLHQNVRPDLIFLDLNMPKKNGKECLTEIRIDAKLKDIPVIIYTTSLNPSDIEACSQGGATNFIRKPNSFEELKSILSDFFNQTNGFQKNTNFHPDGNH